MRIGFLPIDDRPVCYTLPKLITECNPDIEIFIPDRNLLGNLTKYADTESIFKWLKDLENIDALILSLDTAAYGGLISSRRCPETFEKIREKILKLKEILKEKNCKIYAFSSIMRISNNNVNEEEKPYWDKWGKKIFDYSYQSHKLGCESCIHNVIPSDILDDYLNTRKRNFEINKIYLDWQKEGIFEQLIFSKDDCAEYGFNVQEAKFLKDLGGFVKTGADEIPMSLLSRAITDYTKQNLKISAIFIEPDEKNLISNYEDISIEKSVTGQLELAGCEIVKKEDADILLYINNFKTRQGEIVMKIPTECFSGSFVKPDRPFAIADVRFANGSDNNFVKELFKNPEILNSENFLGYSAWNTSANSLGSLICAMVCELTAGSKLNKKAKERLNLTRFLDDWAYQANVRQQLSKPNIEEIGALMRPYEEKLAEILKIEKFPPIKYSYPWNRLFEVEIEFS